MGYTHYWSVKRTLNKKEWSKFTDAVVRAIALSEVKICNGVGEKNPLINEGFVCFNGCAAFGEDYETFRIDRVCNYEHDFCKTARQPYDKVVCAVLILAEKIFGDAISVSSDGTRGIDEGWVEGEKLAERVLQS